MGLENREIPNESLQETLQETSNEASDVQETNTESEDIPILTDAKRIEIIRDLISESDISDEKKWDKLTQDEREEVLRDLGDEIAKALNIEKTKIVFLDMRPGQAGEYNRQSNEIHINRELTSDAKHRINALNTLNHEQRHAFQCAAIKNPVKYGISKELADEWRCNIPPYGKYFSPYIYGIEAYSKQPIERDAFAWEESCGGDII